MESSVINNTMLFQVAVLAWLFLGEQLTLAETLGIVLAVVGTLVVNHTVRGACVARRRPTSNPSSAGSPPNRPFGG